jgi:septum formation protein
VQPERSSPGHVRPESAGLWLASQSPRRVELLRQLGVDPELLLPDPHEDAEALEVVQPGEEALAYVQRVTLAKWQAAAQRLHRRLARATTLDEAFPAGAAWPILCADTTVAVDGRILGKPLDASEAGGMLRQLSGRTHQVMTAVALGHAGGLSQAPATALSISQVTVAELPESLIESYIATGEPFGKAGAYGIQGPFAGWVERIEGSYSGIMGLPLGETRELLERLSVPLRWRR